jgi:hypothetical protein
MRPTWELSINSTSESGSLGRVRRAVDKDSENCHGFLSPSGFFSVIEPNRVGRGRNEMGEKIGALAQDW